MEPHFSGSAHPIPVTSRPLLPKSSEEWGAMFLVNPPPGPFLHQHSIQIGAIPLVFMGLLPPHTPAIRILRRAAHTRPRRPADFS